MNGFLKQASENQQAAMQALSRFSTLARPIDPAYPTNLAIVGLSGLAFLIAILLNLSSGLSLLDNVINAIYVGLAIFFTWVVAREIDPDYDYSALLGAVLTAILLFFISPPPNILALFWAVVITRIANRSAGLPVRIGDTLMVMGLGSALTWSGNWGYGFITTAALALDGWLTPSFPRHRLFAGLMLIITIILFSLNGMMFGVGEALSLQIGVGLIIITLLFLWVISQSGTTQTVGDLTGDLLTPQRIQVAQVMALLIALQLILWDGYAGFIIFSPLWTAMAGIILYRLIFARRSA